LLNNLTAFDVVTSFFFLKLEIKLFSKTDLLAKPMMQYGIGELCTSRRDKTLEDESIWSFIERRFDAQIADNMVDPIFKGIVAGDVKNLSTASLLKAFWEYDAKYVSIACGMIVNTSRIQEDFYLQPIIYLLLLLLLL